jgi:hypothetical protein
MPAALIFSSSALAMTAHEVNAAARSCWFFQRYRRDSEM